MLYEGQALAIIKSVDEAGQITVSVSGDKFGTSSISLTSKESSEETPDRISIPTKQETGFEVYSANRHIYVTGTTDYRIYNSNGTEFSRHTALASGIYFVNSGNTTKKIIVK